MTGNELAARSVRGTRGRQKPGTPMGRQRKVLRAIAIDGASIGEAAARLSMTTGAVRVALHRGLNALAAKFNVGKT
jgi:RNA polymerase sigma-70 factor (ECF subfamily)